MMLKHAINQAKKNWFCLILMMICVEADAKVKLGVKLSFYGGWNLLAIAIKDSKVQDILNKGDEHKANYRYYDPDREGTDDQNKGWHPILKKDGDKWTTADGFNDLREYTDHGHFGAINLAFQGKNGMWFVGIDLGMRWSNASPTLYTKEMPSFDSSNTEKAYLIRWEWAYGSIVAANFFGGRYFDNYISFAIGIGPAYKIFPTLQFADLERNTDNTVKLNCTNKDSVSIKKQMGVLFTMKFALHVNDKVEFFIRGDVIYFFFDGSDLNPWINKQTQAGPMPKDHVTTSAKTTKTNNTVESEMRWLISIGAGISIKLN